MESGEGWCDFVCFRQHLKAHPPRRMNINEPRTRELIGETHLIHQPLRSDPVLAFAPDTNSNFRGRPQARRVDVWPGSTEIKAISLAAHLESCRRANRVAGGGAMVGREERAIM